MPRASNQKIRVEPGRNTVRITISLDAKTKAKAQRNAAAQGFSKSLSSYIAKLIENDPGGGSPSGTSYQ